MTTEREELLDRAIRSQHEALRAVLDEWLQNSVSLDYHNRIVADAQRQIHTLEAERDRLRRAIEDALAWLTDERLNDHQHIEGARVNLTTALEGAEHAD